MARSLILRRDKEGSLRLLATPPEEVLFTRTRIMEWLREGKASLEGETLRLDLEDRAITYEIVWRDGGEGDGVERDGWLGRLVKRGKK
jgi:hypothetical protein